MLTACLGMSGFIIYSAQKTADYPHTFNLYPYMLNY